MLILELTFHIISYCLYCALKFVLSPLATLPVLASIFLDIVMAAEMENMLQCDASPRKS